MHSASPIPDPSSDDEVEVVEILSNSAELEKFREIYKTIIDLYENDPVAFDEKYSKFFNHKVYGKLKVAVGKFKNSTFTEENLNDPSYIVILQTMLKKLAKLESASQPKVEISPTSNIPMVTEQNDFIRSVNLAFPDLQQNSSMIPLSTPIFGLDSVPIKLSPVFGLPLAPPPLPPLLPTTSAGDKSFTDHSYPTIYPEKLNTTWKLIPLENFPMATHIHRLDYVPSPAVSTSRTLKDFSVSRTFHRETNGSAQIHRNFPSSQISTTEKTRFDSSNQYLGISRCSPSSPSSPTQASTSRISDASSISKNILRDTRGPSQMSRNFSSNHTSSTTAQNSRFNSQNSSVGPHSRFSKENPLSSPSTARSNNCSEEPGTYADYKRRKSNQPVSKTVETYSRQQQRNITTTQTSTSKEHSDQISHSRHTDRNQRVPMPTSHTKRTHQHVPYKKPTSSNITSEKTINTSSTATADRSISKPNNSSASAIRDPKASNIQLNDPTKIRVTLTKGLKKSEETDSSADQIESPAVSDVTNVQSNHVDSAEKLDIDASKPEPSTAVENSSSQPSKSTLSESLQSPDINLENPMKRQFDNVLFTAKKIKIEPDDSETDETMDLLPAVNEENVEKKIEKDLNVQNVEENVKDFNVHTEQNSNLSQNYSDDDDDFLDILENPKLHEMLSGGIENYDPNAHCDSEEERREDEEKLKSRMKVRQHLDDAIRNIEDDETVSLDILGKPLPNESPNYDGFEQFYDGSKRYSP